GASAAGFACSLPQPARSKANSKRQTSALNEVPSFIKVSAILKSGFHATAGENSPHWSMRVASALEGNKRPLRELLPGFRFGILTRQRLDASRRWKLLDCRIPRS